MFAGAEGLAQNIDELHKKAAAEGSVNFYGTLAQINAERILPVFEKRFPGVVVKQLDITSDQLVTRATTEARAGKTIGDIFQAPLKTVLQMRDQKLLLDVTLPESKDYPADMKGADWIASNLQFIVVAWNTNLVKSHEEPRQFDDLADSVWKSYAEGGRAPAHPKLKPIDPIKPDKLYPLGVDDIKAFPRYEKIWKEIFKLR